MADTIGRRGGPRWSQLYETAAAQEGHFTTAQAAEAGYYPQLLTKYLNNGRIVRVRRGVYHDLEWTFDAALGRYVLTLSDVPWDNDAVFSGGVRRRLIGRSRRVESFLRLLVPTPDEGADSASIARLVTAL